MSAAQVQLPRAPRPFTRLNVAADGDTVLRIKEVELRVDSRTLRLHSAEFGRFLDSSGNARGPQGASPVDPYPMLLSDASPRAMEILCRVIHDKEDPLAGRLSVGTFSEFSRLAAKYECVPKAKAAAEAWISSLDYKTPGPHQPAILLSLVQAAWHLEHAAYFRELTGYWMENRRAIGGVRENSGMLTVVDVATQDVMRLGTRGQTHLQQAINDFINTVCEHEADTEEHDDIRTFDDPSGGRFACTYHRDMRDVCFTKLKEAGIWPRNMQSEHPDELCDAIKSFDPFEDVPEDLNARDHYQCRRNIQGEIMAAVWEMCDAAEPKYPGLCLQCCKSGGRYECKC